MAKPHIDQLSFFDLIDPEPVAAPVIQSEPSSTPTLVDTLIETGIAPNRWVLENNRGVIQIQGIVSQSRMFRFPMLVHTERLLLVHPDLEAMPFVDDVERKCGIRPFWHEDAYITRCTREWHHAVDLCDTAGYRELLATLNFTTEINLLRAICFKMCMIDAKSSIPAAAAREMLEFVGAPEPAGRSADRLAIKAHDMSSPFCRTDDPAADAWMQVHAFEDKKVKRKGQSIVRNYAAWPEMEGVASPAPVQIEYVVVWKHGDKIDDQRAFSSRSKACRFMAGLEGPCALASPGDSTLYIDEREVA